MDIFSEISNSVIFKILLSVRIFSSMYSFISDCDEAYNYWEPLHMLLFGNGFQTWEYSPLYAIRSWLYIFLHKIPAIAIIHLLPISKVALFFIIRLCISFFTFSGEIFFCLAVGKRFGDLTGKLYVLYSIFSSAMFISSAAFLPSSFSMALNLYTMGFFLYENWFLGIFSTAISALIGWPFAAILGLPIFVEMVFLNTKFMLGKFISYGLVSAFIILVPLLLIDSYMYGKFVFASLNIVLYNIFSKHGPELYGVEPISYYLKNLFLNLNILWPLSLIGTPLIVFAYKLKFQSAFRGHQLRPLLLIYLSTIVWTLIFFAQPHKEERFIYPIYPCVIFLAAVATQAISKILPIKSSAFLPAICIFVTVIFSASRIVAMTRNYSSVVDIYMDMRNHFQSNNTFMSDSNQVKICVGKEWHRFQSSFFLPEPMDGTQFELHFIKSEYRGLLPGRFPSIPIPNSTRMIPENMNDMNQEEPSRYIDYRQCNYIIDTSGTDITELEPNYTEMVKLLQLGRSL